MIVMIGACAAALSLAFATFVGEIGTLSARKAHAQTAADAAALAAVVEASSYGHGEPRAMAVHYADLNDARLVDCLCSPGATAAQVTVEAEGVIARARATFDASYLLPAPGAARGLHLALAAAVARLEAEAAGAVWVVSGYRSYDEQAVLWAEALEKYGSPEVADDWVAPPGHSLHERGLAVDLGGNLELAAELVDRLDLPMHRPLSHEPHHFELLGSR